MHKKYGPIVRTKPNMIHINDPSFADELFPGPGREREKTQFFCDGIPNFNNRVAFATRTHEQHKRERAPLNNFFSKKSVDRMEPVIRDKVDKIMRILSKYASTKKPLDIRLVFTAMTNDIITEYSFGKSWDSLSAEDLNEDFFKAFHDLPKNFHVNSYHPWFFSLMMKLPRSALARLVPTLQVVEPYIEVCAVTLRVCVQAMC